MKNTGRKIFFILIGLAVWQSSWASWPIGKYHYLISPTYSLYAASNGWDVNGKYQISPANKQFMSHTVGLYMAYGLGRRLDVMASLPYTFQIAKNGGFRLNTQGPGDAQFGFTYTLFNFKYANFISLYGGFILPMYTNTATKQLGLGDNGTTLRLSNSGNLGSKTFYNIEVGGIYYTGNDAPKQLTYDVTLGLLADRWNQFSVDVGGVDSYSVDKSFSIATSTARDYWYTKVGLNYGHAFTKRFTMFFTGYYTVMGRNIGQGYGGSVALLLRPPFK